MDVEGKVALVTGAGYGIGRGIALRLAVAGVSVVVNDIDEMRGADTVRLLEGEGVRAAFVRADVTAGDDVRRMITFARDTFGGLDILVNNAGPVLQPPYFPDAPVARWGPVLDAYLRAVMFCTQEALRAMQPRGGAIVNISSGAGEGFRPHDIPEYAAAKAGVMRLTTALGASTAPVRVNCICPGWVATERVRDYVSPMTPEERAAAGIPGSDIPDVDDMVQPSQIGDAVLHFVRDGSLAGRVMLYYEGHPPRLVPADLDLFALGKQL